MKTMVTLAVDIGGTKIASGIIADAHPTDVIHRNTRPTRAREGGAIVLQEVVSAIEDLRRQAESENYDVRRIGIGAPGIVGNGEVYYAGPTMPGWQGTKLTDVIAEHCSLPVAVHNDVRLMGLGEAVYGIGADKEVLFVSIGTGIGGAIIKNGELTESPHHSRGEIAYLLGPTVSGGCDIIENVGSGPAMAKAYGTDSLHPVMADYRDGVPAAVELFDRSLECVGQAIAGFVNAYDVDAVVIGGGVGTLAEAVAPFDRGLKAGLLASHSAVICSQAKLGTNAPLVGAAYFARSKDIQ